MDAQYSQWVDRWQAALDACKRKGGDSRPLVIAPPALPSEVDEIEKQIGHVLPTSFRRVLTDFSANVEMSWFLPNDCELPKLFMNMFAGDCTWGLHYMAVLAEGYQLWMSGYGGDPFDDLVWHDKLAFAEVGNGDLIAFDLKFMPDPPVVYLNHECSDTNGWQLGDNFADFVERYTLLGCSGYDNVLMEPFLLNATSGLDAYGENARRWQKWFGLDFNINP